MSAASFNKVSLMARVAGKPELRETKLGKVPVCAFKLDVHTKKVVSGRVEIHQSTIICEAFGPVAELCAKHTGDGTLVLVEGHLEEDRWEDPTYNRHRSQIKVIVDSVRYPQLSENREEQTLMTPQRPALIRAGAEDAPSAD